MIFNISGRCDIIAFFYPWLKARLKAGFVDVRHPFNPSKVFRYDLSKENTDVLLVCTKNPLPIVEDPQPLLDYCTIIHVTLTPYGSDLEPHVPPKKQIINAVIKLSQLFGKEHIFVRYDPIVVNDKYTASQHIASFEHLVKMLSPYVHAFIISFVDEYKNTTKNGIFEVQFEDIEKIAKGFGDIAKKYQCKVQSCSEPYDLTPYGIIEGKCFDEEHLSRLSGKMIEWTKEKSKREFCACADYRDIGAYNSCLHYCRYCYANFDEKEIVKNYRNHDPNSSLLIGTVHENDEIIEVLDKARQMKLF